MLPSPSSTRLALSVTALTAAVSFRIWSRRSCMVWMRLSRAWWGRYSLMALWMLMRMISMSLAFSAAPSGLMLATPTNSRKLRRTDLVSRLRFSARSRLVSAGATLLPLVDGARRWIPDSSRVGSSSLSFVREIGQSILCRVWRSVEHGEHTVQWPPRARNVPSSGSGGGCKSLRSSGRLGIRETILEATASAFPSCHALVTSSKRASLSGVNSRQKKSGGLGNVDELVSACSAMADKAVMMNRGRRSRSSSENMSSSQRQGSPTSTIEGPKTALE